MKEEVVTYDTNCEVPSLPPFEGDINPNDCIVPIEISNKWDGRVNVYYQLTNFYQNHKDYMKSRNDFQLRGADLSVDELESCSPFVTNEQLGKTQSVNGKPLVPNAPAIPCGVIAKSIFNDTFSLYTDYPDLKVPEINKIAINTGRIGEDADLKIRNKNLISEWEDRQWIDMTSGK